MKRSYKKINYIDFINYHKVSYFFSNEEKDRKLHEFILKKIDKKEINMKNFRKYLDLKYIKKEIENEELRLTYENSPCGTNNHIGEQDEI